MEAKSEMGQVGYVTHKLTELDISKEDNKVVGDGTFPAKYKTSENSFVELADGVPSKTDDCVGNGREEQFIYSGNGINLVLDDNENEVSKDCMPGESEKGYSVSALRTDCKTGQEITTKSSKTEEYIGPNIIVLSENINKRHEINLKSNRYQLSMNIPEDDIEVDFNITSSSAENEKFVKLSSTECEKTVSVISELSFTSSEQENAHNLAMICTPPEEDKEITKQLLSPEFEESEKKEHFIYSEPSLNAVIDDGAYSCERFKDNVQSEYEKMPGRSAIRMKDEDIVAKIAPSKYEKEKDVGMKFIFSEDANKYEKNMKQNHNELFMNISEDELEDKNEINFDSASLKYENDHSKIMNLSPEFEKKAFIQSLAEDGIINDLGFTPPERENGHDVAMIWTQAGYKDETEIPKQLLSPESEENEKEEHFIYSEHGMNFVLAENKNEYKISKDCLRQCDNRFSLKEQEMASSKCETEKGIGEISLAYKSANNRELIVLLNRCEDTKNILKDEHKIQKQTSEHEKCINLPYYESEKISLIESSVENKVRSKLSFTPPERENANDLAIISVPFEGKPQRDTLKNMLSPDCEKDLQIVDCSSIHPVYGTEQTIINGDSSPECNNHIEANSFVCDECKCEREFINDLSCSKVEANKETSGNECDDGSIYIKPNKLERKVIFLKNPVSGDYKNQQDAGKDSILADCKSRNIPTRNLSYGKYSRGNKTAKQFQEKYQKESLHCQSDFKFGRTNSTTSHTSNEENFQVPCDSLAEKIVHQAEFYFSDFNILKNNFLLKHIRRNREGFLSLKLVSSFRKIKALTKDWRVVAYSLEGSKLLELNAEKSKVRRIEKIPKLRDTSYGKTVVAFNLPFKYPSAQDIKELFSKFGTVVCSEIVTVKSPSYNIYHKRCRYFNQEISSNEFGVVEFEKYEDALAAVKDEDSHLPKENEMKVVPLMPPKYRSDPANTRGSSTTSFANSRRRFKPRSEMQKVRQGDDAKPTYTRPPITEKYYRGNYRPRYAGKPQSYTDVRGKLPSERIVGKHDEAEKSHQVRRQLKASNTLNVNPLYQQHRGVGHGPGRFYPGSRFHGARDDI